MRKILILSVGGSPEPIINAIRFYQPDFVYFFCSSGPKGSAAIIDAPGDPCGDKRKSKCPKCGHEYYLGNPKGKAIAFQSGLSKEKYEIIEIEDPDDLNECYLKLTNLADKIKKKYPQAQVIANYYTGGTKTMSVAITLVGIMTQEWDLSLNKGPRLDTIKIRSGDTPVVIDKWQIFSHNRLESVSKALKDYNYSLAEHLVSESLLHPLPPSLEKKLLQLRQIFQAFNYWDKFNHQKALDLLQPYGSYLSSYIIILKKILRKTNSSGYELVADLFNNADRKRAQSQFDDAVARLYRATELFAQIRLEKEYGYKSSNLKLNNLREDLREEYKNYPQDNKGRILLGLREDYELLNKLNDLSGKKFKQNEDEILNALSYRNSSIYAHGLNPLGEKEYLLVKDRLKGFILEVSKKIGFDLQMKQLPTEEIIRF